jgi:surfactin synthase thioesterase subunit
LLCFPQRRPAASVRLYCLPHAGAGASAFATWGLAASHELEIAAVQLPGRENRIDEEPVGTLDSAAELIAEAITVNKERPFALFGHSLGGKLAVRVAILLEKTDHCPIHLFVSGAPTATSLQDRWICNLEGDEFVRAVANRFGGLPSQITDDPEIWRLFERPLRADLRALATDTLAPYALTVPLTIITGARDTVVCANEQLWQPWSAQKVQYVHIDADHFSYRTEPRLYLKVIFNSLFLR